MKGRNGGEMTGRSRVWRAESALFSGLRHREGRTERGGGCRRAGSRKKHLFLMGNDSSEEPRCHQN